MGSRVLNPGELSISERVEADGLFRTIGVSHLGPWPGYDRLTSRLKRHLGLAESDLSIAGSAGADRTKVLLFPYDFRQDMATSADRLWHAVEAVRDGRRVVMVGHSMGGLVARWWWAVLGGHTMCDGLITVGTPHRGAPRALDWVLNGPRLGGRHFPGIPLTEVVRGWPSVYDLLPRYPAITDPTRPGAPLYPHELTGSFNGYQQQAQDAYARHLRLDEACAQVEPGTGGVFLALYAKGHATASRAQVVGGRVSVTKDDPEWLDLDGWQGGDGTVPALSATPPDRPAVGERCWVKHHHLPIASAVELVRFIGQFGQADLGAIRGSASRGPWISFDYDDVVPADQSSIIGFQLQDIPSSDHAAASVQLSVGDGAPTRLRVEREGSRWLAEVPGLPEGVHTLTARIAPGPDADPVEATTAIGVVTL